MTYLTVPFFTYVFSIVPVWLPWLAVSLVAMYMLLFLERFDPRTFVFWTAIVFVVPFAGFLMYLLWGCTVPMRAEGRAKAGSDRDFMEGQSDPVPDRDRRLADLLSGSGADAYTVGNEVSFHWRARESIESLLEALSGAERTIHIEANRLLGGEYGRRMADILCRKAGEGVDVRILTSALGFGRTPYLRGMKAAGVSHRTFHSGIHAMFAIKPSNRCLRDICVIDGVRGFTGMGAYVEFEGRASSRAERRFLADWCHASGEKEEPGEDIAGTGGCGIQLVPSGPDAPDMPLLHGYSGMISDAREKLFVTFPYLVPGDEMYNSIKQAVIAGTDVRLLIPARCRHWYQAWNSLAAAGPLIDAGARVYFAPKAMVKSMVVADGRVCTIGSGVYNSRSLWADYGLNAVVYSEDIAHQAEEEFMKELDGAVECEYRDYTGRSIGDRLKMTAARMLMFLNRWDSCSSSHTYINQPLLADPYRCSNGRLQSHSERCQDRKVLQHRRHRSPRELSDWRMHRRGR